MGPEARSCPREKEKRGNDVEEVENDEFDVWGFLRRKHCQDDGREIVDQGLRALRERLDLIDSALPNIVGIAVRPVHFVFGVVDQMEKRGKVLELGVS